MPDLNVTELIHQMLAAAAAVAGKEWPAIRDYAEIEFSGLVYTAAYVGEKTLTGDISREDAVNLMEMQKNRRRAVLLSIQGQSEVMLESAINAALKVARSGINVALGFALL